jgi:hypothetical protein
MEAPPHQQSPEWDWLNWEGDEAGDIFEVASMGLPTFLKDVSGTEDADDNQDVPLDARLARGDIQSHILDNQGSGEIPNVNPLELEWGSMAGITPPELLVSGDSGWSPGSGSSSFNSPLTTWESPYLSPNLLLGQSPLPAFPFSFPPSNSPYAVCRVNGFPICASPSTATEIPCHLPDPLPGTSSLQEFPHGCPSNMSLYAVPGLAPYDVSLDRPAALSGQAGAQEPRWQATATNRSPALQGHPARLSAYVPSTPSSVLFLIDSG